MLVKTSLVSVGIIGYLLLVSVVGVGCAHGPRKIPLHYSSDIKLDHDQVMVCAYDHQMGKIGCMTPQEFDIRREAGQFR